MAPGTIARCVAAAALLLASTGLASAQNFDGDGILKFGVFGQGTFLNFDETLPTAAGTSPGGFAGGLSFGYDYSPYRTWLIGLDADVSFGDVRGDIDTVPRTSYGFDYLATIKGRVGGFVHPHWLLYGTGGVAWLGFEAQSDRGGPANEAFFDGTAKQSETVTGWVAGVGTEFEAWHHVIFFAEYLHAGFGSRDFNLNSNATISTAIPHSVSTDLDAVRLGVKFKIGHDYNSLGRHYDPYK